MRALSALRPPKSNEQGSNNIISPRPFGLSQSNFQKQRSEKDLGSRIPFFYTRSSGKLMNYQKSTKKLSNKLGLQQIIEVKWYKNDSDLDSFHDQNIGYRSNSPRDFIIQINKDIY